MVVLTDGMAAFGTFLQIDKGGGGYVTIAEVKNISGPSLSVDTIDATSHGSTDKWKECIAGALDAGEVTFDISFIPTEDTHDYVVGLIHDMTDKTLRGFKVIWSDPVLPAIGTTWGFSAFITKFPPAAAVADSLNASCTLKISGKPTLV